MEWRMVNWFSNMEFPGTLFPLPDDMLNDVTVALLTIFITTVAAAAVVAARLYFKKKPKGCLDPEKFVEFKLVKRTKVTHNVARFRFSLPTPTSVLGLPVGHHIRCRGNDSEGEAVIRPYTPITLDSDLGYFELVVKGRFKYKPGQVRAFGMLAGGTGITPMFQEELDVFASKFPNRFKVYYVVTQAPTDAWNGGVGHVSKEMIQSHCPSPGPNIQILRCGPAGMNKAMAVHLNAIGYTSEMQFEF
ncbi:hypothetical protein TEA_021917 [Camellia sinensis var. sinensis]|uniref:cytochrome-b5 reductase n=1 Tax=Camellia sinensis var. sinensis TaxID=542762 RepID=A0A4S4F3K3_CAMSN|nr:hypothetical protein TEA_021917 [Camellia sinensis var. sinensis]